LAAPQPPRGHAAVEVLACALVVLHLPLFLVFPPAGALALLLGLALVALGGALSRRWARDELLRRVERAMEPRKVERRGDGIRGDVSALAEQRGADRRPDRR
jgi:hypothetical protein